MSNGLPMYEEDFLVDRRPLRFSGLSMLQCYAYGECLWRDYMVTRRSSRSRSLEFITAGRVLVTTDMGRYVVESGELFMLQNGVVRPDKCAEMRKRTLIMEGELLNYCFRPGEKGDFFRLKPHRLESIVKIFDDIKNLMLDDNADSMFDISVRSYALLCELERQAAPVQYPESLKAALRLIDKSEGNTLSVPEISSKCGCSVSTLSRLFRKHLKTSPAEHMTRRRLAIARRLLSHSRMTIEDIAEAAGFNSLAYFSRAFKQDSGQSPSAFRQSEK